MFDSLYENIGGKIKTLAKWMFIVEAIGAIITGLFLAIEEDILFIFIAIVGPIIAWVSSWILYGFGELIEDTSSNENYTRQILEKLNEKSAVVIAEKSKHEAKPATNGTSTHKWRCDGCNEMRTQTPCEHCGKE